MAREKLETQIRLIQDEVLLLARMVEGAILDATQALCRQDVVLAQRICENDQEINGKRYAIENAILILIATQQPIAHDLRNVAAMLEVINELERIGDYAKGICKVTRRLDRAQIIIPAHEFDKMAEQGVSMLHRSLSAFVNENSNLAAIVAAEDEIVDDLYNHVYRRVIEAMIQHPDTIDQANLLLWVAHNLERTADRVVNICERVIFIATGELLEFESSDEEDVG
jgi:phosphate transport system protein